MQQCDIILYVDILDISYWFRHFFADLMKKHPSRIVNVSAVGASAGKIDFKKLTSFTTEANQYIVTKLCQILFTIEFARRYKNTNITAYSLHPGVIKTEIFRNLSPIFRWFILFLIDTFFKVKFYVE